MQSTPDTTTVLCLFHTYEQASKALNELQSRDIPEASISVLNGNGAPDGGPAGHAAVLEALGLPDRDTELLHEGIHKGGTVIIVSGQEAVTDIAENIFSRHYGKKIDEKVIGDGAEGIAEVAGADTVIPVIEEELVVGKRQVQTGGVRVYSRVVEVPVEETVTLHQEHAVVERHAVDRAVTEADIQAMRVQSIEVTESEEVAVVNKSARVVEEVQVSKEATERTQHISETVRSTEVEIDPIETGTTSLGTKRGNL